MGLFATAVANGVASKSYENVPAHALGFIVQDVFDGGNRRQDASGAEDSDNTGLSRRRAPGHKEAAIEMICALRFVAAGRGGGFSIAGDRPSMYCESAPRPWEIFPRSQP